MAGIFSTGDADAIRRLTGRRVSLSPRCCPVSLRYASLMVLTPGGRTAYIYGLEFAPRDLRLALVEAAARRIGSPIKPALTLLLSLQPPDRHIRTGHYTGIAPGRRRHSR